MDKNLIFKKITNHLKINGFVFPNSELYGGIKNQYDWGPLGVEIKNNLKQLLWKWFITNDIKHNVVGYDGAILSSPQTWVNSQHEKLFFDNFSDCKDCKTRFKLDDFNLALNKNYMLKELNELILKKQVACLKCGSKNLNQFRKFNMLFDVNLSLTNEKVLHTYLRPETAQNIFVNLKSIVNSQRLKFPFGVGQLGKAFRNETTLGNFIFRTKEFEQFELEYFVFSEDWEAAFDYYVNKTKEFMVKRLGIPESIYKNNFKIYNYPKSELAHYSKKTVDIIFDFGFGEKELLGIAYRGDFDLLCHFKKDEISFYDPFKNKKFIPHVVELSIGIERLIFALLTIFYEEENNNKSRVVLKLPYSLSPYKIAVLPLVGKLKTEALEVYRLLKRNFSVIYDDSGSIGKRYYRQDAIGTYCCITYDYDSKTDDDVTVRNRDTMKQERIKINELLSYFKKISNEY